MRILLAVPHPMMPTGYGQQAALLIPRLIGLGHQVAVSANSGVDSHMSTWEGVTVYPKTPYQDLGEDVVLGHYQHFKADLVITLNCTWILHPQAWRPMRVIHVTPVDCEPMSGMDYSVIVNSGGMPAAISKFGLKQMRAKGLDPWFLPHGIDTAVFKPPADRDQVRDAAGVTGKFVVGLNFMNNDRYRKAIYEQLAAFARFHAKHPDAMLAMHAIMMLPEGWHLPRLCARLGIAGAVLWSDQYQLLTGQAPPEAVATWYSMCDVVSNIGNEGFGLPIVEAQACGTPVVVASWSTGPELCGAGWKVRGQPFGNNAHDADWHIPFISSIETAYERAYASAHLMRGQARRFALQHDIGKVVDEHWKPVLDSLG